MWWEFHRLMDLTAEQLVDEDEPIGLLEPVGPVDEERKGQQTWRYRFPTRTSTSVGGDVFDPANKQARSGREPVRLGRSARSPASTSRPTVDIKRSGAAPARGRPAGPVRTTDHQRASYRARRVGRRHGIDGEARIAPPATSCSDVPPRAGGWPDAPLRRPDETGPRRRPAASRWRSTARPLAIQGPPGIGQDLHRRADDLHAARGRQAVGITGTSHKVIGNLLDGDLKAARRRKASRSARSSGERRPGPHRRRVGHADNRDGRRPARSRRRAANLGGRHRRGCGRREDWRRRVDVLFVDEAGQISLANVVAMAPATASLVLLGDPQQLDQPLRVIRQAPSGRRSPTSWATPATMPPDRGLFLETTWRLHPDPVRLHLRGVLRRPTRTGGHLAVQRRRPDPTSLVDGTGPRVVQVHDRGADNESPEEADAVADLVPAARRAATRTDETASRADDGATSSSSRRTTPRSARSSGASAARGARRDGRQVPGPGGADQHLLDDDLDAELAPRGMDFLYSRNRLNVATSRARCVAIVVASPDLFRVRARTPEQMRLANAFCRFAELAASLADGPPRAPAIAGVLSASTIWRPRRA